MSRARLLSLVVVITIASSACKEGGTVAVHSLEFKGATHVDVALLKSALALV